MKRIIDAQAQERMNITGLNIRKARRKAKLTQKDVTARLETMAIYICRGSLSRIENGSRVVTDIELQAIAQVLNVSIEDLFEHNDND